MAPARQVVFLVGGLGTRLGLLTRAIPKPLLQVAGRPFLSYLIDKAVEHGLRDFVFLAGHHSDQIFRMHETYEEIGRTFRDANLRFRVVHERTPAGTGGALLNAREYLDDEFFLLNGDSLFDFDWLNLLASNKASDWLGMIALRHVPDTTRYGLINLEGEKIQTFTSVGSDIPGLINGGVYLLRCELLDLIDHTPCSLEREVFPRVAREGRLYGRAYNGYFIDIGVPEDFARAEREINYFRKTP